MTCPDGAVPDVVTKAEKDATVGEVSTTVVMCADWVCPGWSSALGPGTDSALFPPKLHVNVGPCPWQLGDHEVHWTYSGSGSRADTPVRGTVPVLLTVMV